MWRVIDFIFKRLGIAQIPRFPHPEPELRFWLPLTLGTPPRIRPGAPGGFPKGIPPKGSP